MTHKMFRDCEVLGDYYTRIVVYHQMKALMMALVYQPQYDYPKALIDNVDDELEEERPNLD